MWSGEGSEGPAGSGEADRLDLAVLLPGPGGEADQISLDELWKGGRDREQRLP